MSDHKYHKYKKKYLHQKQNSSIDPKFSLSVRDPWLFYIQTGIKTVEGRTGNLEKFKHWIDQKVYFFNRERKIPVKVIKIRHYPDLYTYLKEEGYDKVLPTIKSFEDAVDMYHEFYSDQIIKSAGGMLAIEVKII